MRVLIPAVGLLLSFAGAAYAALHPSSTHPGATVSPPQVQYRVSEPKDFLLAEARVKLPKFPHLLTRAEPPDVWWPRLYSPIHVVTRGVLP
jgi:hypothetical protein